MQVSNHNYLDNSINAFTPATREEATHIHIDGVVYMIDEVEVGNQVYLKRRPVVDFDGLYNLPDNKYLNTYEGKIWVSDAPTANPYCGSIYVKNGDAYFVDSYNYGLSMGLAEVVLGLYFEEMWEGDNGYVSMKIEEIKELLELNSEFVVLFTERDCTSSEDYAVIVYKTEYSSRYETRVWGVFNTHSNHFCDTLADDGGELLALVSEYRKDLIII